MDERANFSRTLRQLAVIDAWFKPVPETSPPRYTLHMNVAFQQERMGGGEKEPVRFRLTLKRCQVVVMMPVHTPGLSVDRETISRTSATGPINLSVETGSSAGSKGSVQLGVDPKSLGLAAKAGWGREEQSTLKTQVTRSMPLLVSTSGRSDDGHPCWTITASVPSELLVGSLWEPVTEPRFQLVDTRPEATLKREKLTNMHPEIVVEIRCKREDLEITDIRLKDNGAETRHSEWFGSAKRRKAAEAFIKHELQANGLRVGNMAEIFSDLVVADRVIPLHR